jgi:gliding motility-associated-like protein
LKYFLAILLAFISYYGFATHNRAGEITYEQIGPLKVRMTVTTYTKESSKGADRDSLEIFWGDGTKEWVIRANGIGQSLENDVKVNKYIAEHTYPGRSSYTITFIDPNRSGNILNINYPRSDDVKFFLSTRLTLLDIQFQGSNSSVVLLQPPIDIGCVGQPFIHNPNAYDVDGDSLSYELIAPLEAEGKDVPNYLFPDQILPGPNNLIFLNKNTGDFIWRNPPQIGEYNIAMRINEWRGGVLINSIVRDMQILVKDCKSKPPVIKVEEEICVIAGTEINLPIEVSDPDINQKVKLSVTGGPFILENDKAILVAPKEFSAVPFKANLIWKTTCDLISKQYYQVVIKAMDNSIGDTFGLATLKTIKIKVVGPAPEDVTAKADEETNIKVEWKDPYDCEITKNDYFFGFSVWRKTQSIDIPVDTCNVASLKGTYTRIVFNTKQKDDKGYFIIDKDVKPNTTYCYRVVAEFAFKTASGNPFKRVESIYSNEVCIQLKRDIPLLTKVSVSNTNSTNGQIELKWTKPLLIDFDTIKFKGPYRIEILRSLHDKNTFSLIQNGTKVSQNFKSWTDTSHVDNGLNTANEQYDYKLNFFYNDNIAYKPIPQASSVFLTVTPSDKKNLLNFNFKTPWANKSYNIYRKDATGNFQLIGKTVTNNYVDDGLSNEENYCYKVESIGTYSIPRIEQPLINFSQEACSIPVDNIAPCSPILDVKTICDNEIITATLAENILQWTLNKTCGNDEPIDKYNVYFKENKASIPKLIATVTNNQLLEYKHQPDSNSIAGCYTISAVDNKNNESQPSNEVCIDNCPVYILPNTFTPNNDGSNESFVPIKNFFIESVDFKIFNEWGNKIFETSNPQLNWNGKTKSGENVADGTYYYTCIYYSKKAEGITKSPLIKGYINIIR